MTKHRRSLDDILGPFSSAGAEDDSPRRVRAAPSRAARRGEDHALVGGAYEGASRTNRDLALWNPPLRSADADVLYEREAAMGRSRDLGRNDAYVQSGENLHRDSIVGSKFSLNAKPNIRVLGLDEAWAKEFQEEVEAKFDLYAESPDCWIDASRMNTLTGLVRLAIGVYLYGGEVLATSEWIRQRDRPYNTAIQMIECERLSNPYGVISQGTLRGGVEHDRWGAPIAYWIRQAHESDLLPESMDWKRYPARLNFGRQRVIHIMEQRRIAQTRGISEMVSALKEMRVTKRFRDIVLQNAVVNATYAATIEADLPQSQAFETLGANEPEALVDFAEAYLGTIADYAANSKNLAIDGVRIPHLFPGTKLQLRPAGKGGPLGENFEASLLRYIAANLGVSYEELSRDYSQTTYAGFKAGAVKTQQFMWSRKNMVADRFASSAYRLWFEEAVNLGQIETMKGRPDFYADMNKDAYTQAEWLGAPRGQIDELKETQAAVLRVNNNLSTLEDELGRQGKDWRAVIAQRQREREELEERGLLPPENDPMMNAASGQPAQRDDEGGNEERAR